MFGLKKNDPPAERGLITNPILASGDLESGEWVCVYTPSTGADHPSLNTQTDRLQVTTFYANWCDWQYISPHYWSDRRQMGISTWEQLHNLSRTCISPLLIWQDTNWTGGEESGGITQ